MLSRVYAPMRINTTLLMDWIDWGALARIVTNDVKNVDAHQSGGARYPDLRGGPALRIQDPRVLAEDVGQHIARRHRQDDVRRELDLATTERDGPSAQRRAHLVRKAAVGPRGKTELDFRPHAGVRCARQQKRIAPRDPHFRGRVGVRGVPVALDRAVAFVAIEYDLYAVTCRCNIVLWFDHHGYDGMNRTSITTLSRPL